MFLAFQRNPLHIVKDGCVVWAELKSITEASDNCGILKCNHNNSGHFAMHQICMRYRDEKHNNFILSCKLCSCAFGALAFFLLLLHARDVFISNWLLLEKNISRSCCFSFCMWKWNFFNDFLFMIFLRVLSIPHRPLSTFCLRNSNSSKMSW